MVLFPCPQPTPKPTLKQKHKFERQRKRGGGTESSWELRGVAEVANEMGAKPPVRLLQPAPSGCPRPHPRGWGQPSAGFVAQKGPKELSVCSAGGDGTRCSEFCPTSTGRMNDSIPQHSRVGTPAAPSTRLHPTELCPLHQEPYQLGTKCSSCPVGQGCGQLLAEPNPMGHGAGSGAQLCPRTAARWDPGA